MPAWNALTGPKNVFFFKKKMSLVIQPLRVQRGESTIWGINRIGKVIWKRGRGVSNVGNFSINYLGLRAIHQICQTKVAERKDEKF